MGTGNEDPRTDVPYRLSAAEGVNGALCFGEPLRVLTAEKQGELAAIIALEPIDVPRQTRFSVEIAVRVHEGSIALGFLANDGDDGGDEQVIVHRSGTWQKVSLLTPPITRAGPLVIRNASASGPSRAQFRIVGAAQVSDSYLSQGSITPNGKGCVQAATGRENGAPETPERVFAIITWGCAASKWISQALGAHPKIFCRHKLNWDWSRISETPLLDGVRYLEFLQRNFGSYRAVGDVHGVNYLTVPELRKAFGDRFGCAVIVREPIARLRSVLALFANFEAYRGWDLSNVRPFLDRVIMPVDCFENRLILHGIAMLNQVESEHAIAPIWRCEDLTTNTSALARFIHDLTGIKLAADSDWIASVINRPRSNAHALSPIAFDDWVIEAIQRIVKPRAWELYAELGYPIPSFVDL